MSNLTIELVANPNDNEYYTVGLPDAKPLLFLGFDKDSYNIIGSRLVKASTFIEEWEKIHKMLDLSPYSGIINYLIFQHHEKSDGRLHLASRKTLEHLVSLSDIAFVRLDTESAKIWAEVVETSDDKKYCVNLWHAFEPEKYRFVRYLTDQNVSDEHLQQISTFLSNKTQSKYPAISIDSASVINSP